MATLLNVGSAGHKRPDLFADYEETRLDIDPACAPDIVASMTDMGEIGTYDLVLCSHALEHLYPHDVSVALSEFRRVLNPGGGAVILVPDLQDVRPTEDVLYRASDDGDVTGLDLIYGLRCHIKRSVFWAHHTGFTEATLSQALKDAGFSKITTQRLPLFNLLGAAIK